MRDPLINPCYRDGSFSEQRVRIMSDYVEVRLDKETTEIIAVLVDGKEIKPQENQPAVRDLSQSKTLDIAMFQIGSPGCIWRGGRLWCW